MKLWEFLAVFSDFLVLGNDIPIVVTSPASIDYYDVFGISTINLRDGRYYLPGYFKYKRTRDEIIEARGEIPESWMDLPIYNITPVMPSKEFCIAHRYVDLMISVCVAGKTTPRVQHEPLFDSFDVYQFYNLERPE